MPCRQKRYKCDSIQRTECSLDPVTSPLLRIYTSPLRNILEPTYNSLQTSHARLQEPHQSHITQYHLRSIPRPKAAKMPSSYQSQTFSSVSSSVNGQTTSRTQSTYSDNSGTRVHQTSQEPGQAPREERYEIDNNGRRIADGSTSGSNAGRITEVSDEQQKENDRLYKERMEDEYAKREGGA
jgi:hypothetical protein